MSDAIAVMSERHRNPDRIIAEKSVGEGYKWMSTPPSLL
jgi:hypothetical protein